MDRGPLADGLGVEVRSPKFEVGAKRSAALFRRARARMPGGVSSPVRSFAAVGGEPFFVATAKGARLRDAGGRSFLDYVLSYGPLLFGHAPAFVVREVARAVRGGTSFGAPTEREVRLAERVARMVPSIEMVRFVNSGTEAAMSAIRLARAATGRSRIVKTDGGYHGHADSFLVSAGSGVATLGIAGSPGVPDDLASLTTVVPYNDAEALEAALSRFPGQVAAFVLEPIAANMGLVPPGPGYLESARELTARHGTLLVFDEVITGFRVARGGAQERAGVRPDLTVLGKILGGGLPVGAYGGPRELMEQIAPSGSVYQAGTLSGNPLAMAAGIAMLREIDRRPPYEDLERKGAVLEAAIRAAIAGAGAESRVAYQRVGSLSTLFFTEGPVADFAAARRCDTGRYAVFFHAMLERGVFLPPAQFEAWFLSTAHTEADLLKTGRAVEASLRIALENR